VFSTRHYPQITVLALGLLFLASRPAAGQALQWRTEYAAARQEAKEKNRPLLLDFGTKSCVWCKKLDETTFRDQMVVRLLGERFISLKVDGDKEAKLTQVLGVRSYPTLVFAAPDGRIIGLQEGFVSAPDLLKKLQQALVESFPANPPGVAQAPAPPASPSPVVPTGYTTGPEADRPLVARALLALAQDDLRKQQYLLCLERCRVLATGFDDLPEAKEAQKLTARIKGEPELTLRACADLSDRLGELYLALAETQLQQGQDRQAIANLERVLQVSPGTRHSQAARAQLTRLQNTRGGAAAPDQK
jgi:thioredoxin-related protein